MQATEPTKRLLGISIIDDSPVPYEEQIKIFKAVGFDCFFVDHYRSDDPIALYRKIADNVGIQFETIHGPFFGEGDANHLWLEGEIGDGTLEFHMQRLQSCIDFNVPKYIMHTTIGITPPEISQAGIDRFKRLADHAASNGVKLCFENLEPFPHLHRIMAEIPDYHGFCWDVGHNLCYSPHVDMMALYGNRLLCTHIHDNWGVTRPGFIECRDDKHLLPFDGTMDWHYVAEKIKASGYTGPLTLELALKGKKEYSVMDFEDYVQEAYNRAVKLKELCE